MELRLNWLGYDWVGSNLVVSTRGAVNGEALDHKLLDLPGGGELTLEQVVLAVLVLEVLGETVDNPDSNLWGAVSIAVGADLVERGPVDVKSDRATSEGGEASKSGVDVG